MNNKNKRLKRLAQYTSASAAFLAISNHANATVTYRDIDPDSTISSNDTILLDIDLNGTNDVMFWIESMKDTITTPGGANISYTYRFARADALAYNVLVGDQGTNSGYVFQNAYQFNSGDAIGDTLIYFFDDAFLAGAVFYLGVPFYSDGPWSGADGKFLGIRFKIDGFNHWAWIRMSIGAGGSFITIEDLAYDLSADIAITAGVMTEIETPVFIEKPEIYSYASTLHIQTKSDEAFQYAIFDMNGKMLMNDKLQNGSSEISCAHFPTGIYAVNVFDDQRSWTEKVFIIAE